jgi:hypothetical protein
MTTCSRPKGYRSPKACSTTTACHWTCGRGRWRGGCTGSSEDALVELLGVDEADVVAEPEGRR